MHSILTEQSVYQLKMQKFTEVRPEPCLAIYLNLLFYSARLRVKYFELNHRNAEGLGGPGTARSLAGDAAGPGPASPGPFSPRSRSAKSLAGIRT